MTTKKEESRKVNPKTEEVEAKPKEIKSKKATAKKKPGRVRVGSIES